MTEETPWARLASPFRRKSRIGSPDQSVEFDQHSGAGGAFDGPIISLDATVLPEAPTEVPLFVERPHGIAGLSFEGGEASPKSLVGNFVKHETPGPSAAATTNNPGISAPSALGIEPPGATSAVVDVIKSDQPPAAIGSNGRDSAQVVTAVTGGSSPVQTSKPVVPVEGNNSGASDGHGGTVVVDPVPSNSWKELKIGAGGWLTGIDIAPDGTMVVRTDTYGAYIWNGTQWQQLVTTASLSVSGRDYNDGVYEIKIAPSNTNILYMEYLGNVYRSNDKGTSWTKTAFAHVIESPNDVYRMNGQKMAVDPNNPNVVYVGTPQDGLFITTDGGASWQKVSAVPVSAPDANGQYPGITGITFDKTSGVTGGKTNAIYASSNGHGVYKSTDGGLSWAALAGGPSDVQNAAISSTGVYYAIGNNDKSLWRYMNGAWTQLNPAGSNSSFQNPHTVSIDPFNPLHIVVGDQGGALNQSLDGGATWSGMNWNTQLSATDIPWLATAELFMSSGGMVFDPLVPNKLWVSDGTGVWNTTVPQNLLWNTPVVWNSQSVGIEQLVANEILVAPGGHPVVASWDRSFFYVANPDTYPSAYGVGTPKPFSMGWSLDYASSNPNFLVGINDWWGVEQSGYSSDGGQTWHMFPTMPSFAGTAIGGTIAASSPTDIVWAPANGFAPQYTKDGGLTWHPVVLPGVTDWSTFHWAYYLDRQTVTADRVLPDTFYMYSFSNGVFKSTDGGATWTKVFNGDISPGSGFNARIEAVPGEAGNLFFTGGPQGSLGATHPAGESFFQSTDGGATWTAVPNVLEVMTFGFGAPATPGGYPAVYIVGWVNSVYGIWQSNDDAHSWTMIGDYPQGNLDNIKTISGDPNIYGQVYVGFGGSGYAYLPAASVTAPVNQAPVVTASSIQTNVGVPSPSPTIVATRQIDPAPLSEVPATTDSKAAQNNSLQGQNIATMSSPGGAISITALSPSFDSNSVVASVEPPVSLSSDRAQNTVIALLSQYTAAGFQSATDAGAMVSHTTTASTSGPALVSLPNQEFNRGT